MKAQFTVEVAIPLGTTTADMRDYIEEAVQVWCGQLPSTDRMFWIDPKTVKVSMALPRLRVILDVHTDETNNLVTVHRLNSAGVPIRAFEGVMSPKASERFVRLLELLGHDVEVERR